LGTDVRPDGVPKVIRFALSEQLFHRGAYYTLDTIARYDELGSGLSGHHFSRHGTLLNHGGGAGEQRRRDTSRRTGCGGAGGSKDAFAAVVQGGRLYRRELEGRLSVLCGGNERRRQQQMGGPTVRSKAQGTIGRRP